MRRTRLTGDEASSRALAWLGTELVRRQQDTDTEHEVIAVFVEEEVLAISQATRDHVARLMSQGRASNIITAVRYVTEPRPGNPLHTAASDRFDPPLSSNSLDLDQVKQLIDGMMLDIDDRTYGKKKGHQ